jgi:hypothetical protein
MLTYRVYCSARVLKAFVVVFYCKYLACELESKVGGNLAPPKIIAFSVACGHLSSVLSSALKYFNEAAVRSGAEHFWPYHENLF